MFNYLDKIIKQNNDNVSPSIENFNGHTNDSQILSESNNDQQANGSKLAESAVKFGAMPITIPYISDCPHIVEKIKDSHIEGYDVFLFSEIFIWNPVRMKNYNYLTNILENATNDIYINIYIDSPGGVVSLGARIASAIKKSKARVTTIAVGQVMSMGTVVWYAGHNRVIWPASIFMFHQSSHGAYGNSKFVADISKVIVDYTTENLIKPMLNEGFITEEEYKLISRGEDMFIHGEVIKARIEAKLNKETTNE